MEIKQFMVIGLFLVLLVRIVCGIFLKLLGKYWGDSDEH